MNKLEEKNVLFGLLNRVKFGETVLIESDASYISEFMVLGILKYAREHEIPVVIDDNFDTLHLIKIHLGILGIEEDFKDVYVIKTGGIIDVGNVVARVSLSSEPTSYVLKYKKASQEVFKNIEKSMNIVLGLEKLFYFTKEPVEFYTLIGSIGSFIGNKNRKSFYILNRKIAEGAPINPLPELERIATGVIDATPYESSASLRLKKFGDIDLVGKSLIMNMKDLVG
ncbi:DUF257 family protein [Palaeococcus sp. (in: euryarchaeotes)]